MLTLEDLLDLQEKSGQEPAAIQEFLFLVASEYARVRRKLIGEGVDLEHQGITLFHTRSGGAGAGSTITLVMDVHHATERPARYTLSYTDNRAKARGNTVSLDAIYYNEDSKKLEAAKRRPLTKSLPLIHEFIDMAKQPATGTYGETMKRYKAVGHLFLEVED